MSPLVKVTAAVTVLAAAGSYFFAPALSASFLSSPPFLWVAANVIIIWLLSSSRRRSAAADGGAASANDVLKAVDDLYPSSDFEGYTSTVVSGGEAPVAVSKLKRQAVREARNRPARRTDRARVSKKPAGEAAPAPVAWIEAADTPRRLDAKKRVDETPPSTGAAAAAGEGSRPVDDDDVSLDSLWQSMLQRRAVRPVSVRKSETWGNDELPRLQRSAETAARRREMRKSVSSAAPPPPQQPPQAQEAAAPSAVRQLGWRTRDVLVRAQDDLLRRAESLIRRHHEQLRLQRQESEQRRAMERQRGRPALISV